MRALDPDFAAHVASGATTLATCWVITRLDGSVLGFTDHDLPLTIDGTVCDPAHGLDGSEAPTRLGPQVTTEDVIGVLHSDAITEDDILLGRYDGARVVIWQVNWCAPAERLLVRETEIGEIVREDGSFRAELRSLETALNRRGGRTYQALCDAELGDTRCGVEIDAPAYRAEAVVIEGSDRYRVAVEGLGAFAEGWFGLGTARWTSGRRAGLVERILSAQRLGGVDILGFDAPIGDWVELGDELVVSAGCDKSFATCRTRFANGERFRGFPHIPGSDFVLRYPRPGDTLDGRKLVS